jgi:hypothetical protein
LAIQPFAVQEDSLVVVADPDFHRRIKNSLVFPIAICKASACCTKGLSSATHSNQSQRRA